MICDAESLELSQSIEVILGDLPDDLPGEVKPELMQSVLEVATLPCANVAEAGDQLRALRRCVREVAAEQRPRDRRRRHPPVGALRGPADRRPAPLQGAGGGAALDRASRS